MHDRLAKFKATADRRSGERGAALITVLLMSTLLLAVGGALILSATLSLTNSVDATSESMAYYGAEAGLQSALHVLRGNIAPSPLPTPMVAGSPVPPEDQISFRGAVTRSISNLATDPTTLPDGSAFPMRLSHWLQYTYTPSGLNYPDRVPLNAGYNPMTDAAYSLSVVEPDNSQTVSFSTAATFTGGTSSLTLGTNSSGATITFQPQDTTVTAYSPTNINLGSFVVTRTGNGAPVPPNTQINIRITQTAPWKGTIVLGGTLTGKVDLNGTTLKITFSSATAWVSGTLFTLSANPFLINSSSGGGSGTTFNLTGTLTAPEPRRLLVTSTGYGPKGARKVLEMMVNRYKYNVDPPAPITIRGSDNGTTMSFDLGSSAAKRYSGKDFSNRQPKFPTVAIRTQDWSAGYAGINKGSTVDNPKFSILDIDLIPSPWPNTLTPVPSYTPTGSTPPYPLSAQTLDFLQTADAARAFLNDLRATAQARDRYFTTLSGYAGSLSAPDLTFVDGDCTLDGGAGMLIVTGNLTFDGNDDFKGIILVLGNGHVTRSGSGNGRVLGSWIIASFPQTGNGGFTAPYFDVSGGGSGSFYYDSLAVETANKTVGGSVSSVAER